MLSDLFGNKTTLRMIEHILDFKKPISRGDMASMKFSEEGLEQLEGLEIIKCINPDDAPELRQYAENPDSNLFGILMKLDIELGAVVLKQKRAKINNINPRVMDSVRSHKKKEEYPVKPEPPEVTYQESHTEQK